MKTPYFFLLMACMASSAYALPNLDESGYSTDSDSYASNASASVSSTASTLAKLQKDVSQLKKKVNALEHTLYAGTVNSNVKNVNIYATDDHDPTAALPAEKSRYSRAYAIFRDGGNDQAIAEFQAIMNTYPNGEYADNSQYWIGEALLKKGDKQRAMVAFDRVIRVYSRSPKVPDALLKLGMTQYSLGNKSKAKEYYDYLIGAYPGTASANVAYNKKMQAGL